MYSLNLTRLADDGVLLPFPGLLHHDIVSWLYNLILCQMVKCLVTCNQAWQEAALEA